MDDLALLTRLRAMPVPLDLATLDNAVLAGLHDRQQMGSISRKALGTCGALALGIGLAGGAMVGAPAVAKEPALSLSAANALAPSSLLEGRP